MNIPPQQPKKATWRLGPKQRERLQWTVVAIICILLFFAFKPYYNHIVDTRENQICQSNALKIAGAVRRYMEDFDGVLPLGPSWMDGTEGYIAATSGTGFQLKEFFRCPLDNSGQATSYSFNNVMGGISLDVNSGNDEIEGRRKLLGRPDRAPMIIEKHGGQRNASVNIPDWGAMKSTLTRPHFPSQNYGTYISGGGKPLSINDEQLSNRSGKF